MWNNIPKRYLFELSHNPSKIERTFFSLFTDGANTTDWKSILKWFIPQIFNWQLGPNGKAKRAKWRTTQDNGQFNYQKWRWQTISQNALSKDTYSTKVHPGDKNLQDIDNTRFSRLNTALLPEFHKAKKENDQISG